MSGGIDDGWDAYCSRAAGAKLARMAANLWELSGTKESEPIRHQLDTAAHRLRKMAFQDITEAAFVETLRSNDVAPDDVRQILTETKTRAKRLRGQLDMFDGVKS